MMLRRIVATCVVGLPASDKSPEATCIDTDDVSLPAQICHSDNSIVWPEVSDSVSC